jgi:hypothetical protein
VVQLQPLSGGDELPAARDSEENADVIPIHEGASPRSSARAPQPVPSS